MAFLLDTNIVIHAIDGNGSVLDELLRHAGTTFMSALTLVELQRGMAKGGADVASRGPRMPYLTETVPVLPFEEGAALAYGRIIAQCGWSRSRDFDRMIAAHAVHGGFVLVTNNEADFRDVPGLALANWTA